MTSPAADFGQRAYGMRATFFNHDSTCFVVCARIHCRNSGCAMASISNTARDFKACMTEIYLHIYALMDDYVRTHPYACTV